MDVKYFVIRQEPCPTCEGHKWITHPGWSLLYEEHDGIHMTMPQIEQWFREQGYDYPPDGEIPCYECEGVGVLRREVEMSEVLEFIEDRLENLESAVFANDADDPSYAEYNHRLEQWGLPPLEVNP